jgi:hypothetical protein
MDQTRSRSKIDMVQRAKFIRARRVTEHGDLPSFDRDLIDARKRDSAQIRRRVDAQAGGPQHDSTAGFASLVESDLQKPKEIEIRIDRNGSSKRKCQARALNVADRALPYTSRARQIWVKRDPNFALKACIRHSFCERTPRAARALS